MKHGKFTQITTQKLWDFLLEVYGSRLLLSILLIYRGGMFVYYHYGITQIYFLLSYPLGVLLLVKHLETTSSLKQFIKIK